MIGIVSMILLLIAVYIYKYYENFNPERLHFFIDKCEKEYGDVFTVWTPSPMVILMSYESIKQALVTKGEDFTGRMGRYPDDLFITTENGGVIFSEGESWREQRRTAIHIMRDFGMGKNVMEGQVKSSMHEFMRNLDSIEDKSRVDFRWPLQILVANVVNEVLFGYHYKYDDCKRLMDYSDGLAEQAYPNLTEHVRQDVLRCEKTFDENDEAGCFVHAYIQRMKKSDGSLNHLQMLNVCNDFFLAGM
ncbi:hypothetical protein PRIPAC_91080 [Pristionchus pacificus]|uniref:Cytochrome P450 n=1 Tax=Pristionchus pacificus TaxID=54126 RepID=A0A2A6CYZ4_PRIPA|nr:hypothetical protein PRIPAC_91080 [Pristionchus pacificus]|eukprot:PDM83251.1 cytochrome P450 [Pristionchus pacificus]